MNRVVAGIVLECCAVSLRSRMIECGLCRGCAEHATRANKDARGYLQTRIDSYSLDNQ